MLYNSLALAKDNKLTTIAFPSISTGVYGYPKEKAADIAIKAVKDFANKYENMEEIIFVLFSDEDFDIYQEKLRG